jgi:hypothetical protein
MGRPQEELRRDLMGDLQLYGKTNLALGEYRTFKQRSLNSSSISTAKELGIKMPPKADIR